MASLTRNDWLEMWATIKLMESQNTELAKLYAIVGPFRRIQLTRLVNSNQRSIDKIKYQIQSVIGQLE